MIYVNEHDVFSNLEDHEQDTYLSLRKFHTTHLCLK